MVAFRPGTKTRMWGNSYRMSKITDTFELNRMAESIDVTTHEANGDRNFIASLRTGGAKWGGIFAATLGEGQDLIAATLGSTTPNVWTIALEGDAVGSIAHLYRAREKEITVSAPAAGRVGVQGAHDATDHVLNGVMQIQGTAAIATTGAKAAVDGGAASALGGVGHFHVTDTAAALTSVTVKIQHSSASVSWADILTFTTTSTGYTHVETTGLAVKRYTRGIVTALSGASTVYVAAAFARKTA